MSKKYKKIDEELSNMSDMIDKDTAFVPVFSEEDETAVEIPEVLPILTLRSSVLFPGSITPITVARNKSVRLVRDIERQGALLGAVLQKDSSIDEPSPEDLYKIGTVARIIKTLEMPNGNMTVILHGIEKFEVTEYVASEPYFKAAVRVLHDIV
ncbi:MAG: LON peptidase substrate-binding domain-containing protein, partial [Rikenellaceae bacterium]|nr:LON peptidase substrate-binding domain-containing protein [Rikenellaceae bacterium]